MPSGSAVRASSVHSHRGSFIVRVIEGPAATAAKRRRFHALDRNDLRVDFFSALRDCGCPLGFKLKYRYPPKLIPRAITSAETANDHRRNRRRRRAPFATAAATAGAARGILAAMGGLRRRGSTAVGWDTGRCRLASESRSESPLAKGIAPYAIRFALPWTKLYPRRFTRGTRGECFGADDHPGFGARRGPRVRRRSATR